MELAELWLALVALELAALEEEELAAALLAETPASPATPVEPVFPDAPELGSVTRWNC